MSIVQNVNKSLSWIKVANLLNLKILSAALPSRTTCPLCDNPRLLILADPSTHGQWHYCPDCGSNGSLVELAAKCWKVTTGSALLKLHSEIGPLPKEILSEAGVTEYETKSKTIYEDLKGVWNKAKDSGLLNDPTIQNLSKQHMLSVPTSKEQYKHTVNEIIGALDAREIYEFFTGETVKRADNTMAKIFGDTGWGSVLIFPFYDMPGRINSFLCVGRDGDREKDIKLAQLVANKDAGLQLHPKLLKSKSDTVIAFEDPFCYLFMSIRKYNISSSPAPFVLWYSNKDIETQINAWNMVGDKTIIFWHPTRSKDTIKQAIKVNGMISTYSLSEQFDESVYNRILAKPVAEVLRNIKKHAKPWPQALDVIIENMSDEELEIFYLQLNLSDKEIDSALRRCSYATCLRLDNLIRTKHVCRSIIFDNKQVEIRPDGIYYISGNNEELVVDAILKIDSVTHYPSSNKSVYSGAISYNGKDYPFDEDVKIIESSTLSWMRDSLVKQKAGLLRYNPRWNSKIISISTMVQKPKCHIGVEKVGWSENERAIVFPKYSITLDGDVRINTEQEVDLSLPAAHLPFPKTFTSYELEDLLDDTEENSVFWGMWGLCVSNIIAPLFNARPTGISVYGFSGKAVTALMDEIIGFAAVKDSELTSKGFKPTHNWPYIFGFLGDVKSSEIANFVRTISDDYYPVILKTNWYQSISLLLSGGWHSVMLDDPIVTAVKSTDIQKALLPSYISYLLNRPLTEFIRTNNFVLDVFNDVYRWLSEYGVDAEIVRTAVDKVLPDNDSLYATHFGELLTQLVDDGELTVANKSVSPEDLTKKLRVRSELVAMPEYGGVLVPGIAVARCLEKHHAKMPSTFDISKRLLAADAIVGEVEIGSGSGWILKFEWWDSVSHRYRLKRMNTFNIVG